LKAWTIAIALSLIATGVAYWNYGLTAENVMLHGSAVVVEYLALLSWGYAIHRAMRVCRIDSRLAVTFGLFTTVVAPIAPFATLVAIPGIQRAAGVTTRDVAELLREAWALTQELDDAALTKLIAVLHPLVVLAGLIAIATFVIAASRHYGVATRRTGRAVALATAIGLPLILAPLLGLLFVIA
jgi:hypothetical protein